MDTAPASDIVEFLLVADPPVAQAFPDPFTGLDCGVVSHKSVALLFKLFLFLFRNHTQLKNRHNILCIIAFFGLF